MSNSLFPVAYSNGIATYALNNVPGEGAGLPAPFNTTNNSPGVQKKNTKLATQLVFKSTPNSKPGTYTYDLNTAFGLVAVTMTIGSGGFITAVSCGATTGKVLPGTGLFKISTANAEYGNWVSDPLPSYFAVLTNTFDTTTGIPQFTGVPTTSVNLHDYKWVGSPTFWTIAGPPSGIQCTGSGTKVCPFPYFPNGATDSVCIEANTPQYPYFGGITSNGTVAAPNITPVSYTTHPSTGCLVLPGPVTWTTLLVNPTSKFSMCQANQFPFINPITGPVTYLSSVRTIYFFPPNMTGTVPDIDPSLLPQVPITIKNNGGFPIIVNFTQGLNTVVSSPIPAYGNGTTYVPINPLTSTVGQGTITLTAYLFNCNLCTPYNAGTISYQTDNFLDPINTLIPNVVTIPVLPPDPSPIPSPTPNPVPGPQPPNNIGCTIANCELPYIYDYNSKP